MHRFDVSPKEAVQLQLELKSQVKLVPLTKPITHIGGCDVSMNRFAKEGFAGFIMLTNSLEPVAHSVVKDRIPFPYVPGLLSFREIPMLMKAWETLTIKPDVLIVDGIGIAHPRRFGIASHLGV
ncbi:MAG TPA: endonuclease V, partial [Candidatus Paceibacterota bacterium]|nr:endonuclease V [Candidatus Paceibacterota bacterium]